MIPTRSRSKEANIPAHPVESRGPDRMNATLNTGVGMLSRALHRRDRFVAAGPGHHIVGLGHSKLIPWGAP